MYSPHTQKQIIYGRVTSCRTRFVVFGISVVGSFLSDFPSLVHPRWPYLYIILLCIVVFAYAFIIIAALLSISSFKRCSTWWWARAARFRETLHRLRISATTSILFPYKLLYFLNLHHLSTWEATDPQNHPTNWILCNSQQGCLTER